MSNGPGLMPGPSYLMNMKYIFLIGFLVVVLNSCSWKHLHKSRPVNLEDGLMFDTVFCNPYQKYTFKCCPSTLTMLRQESLKNGNKIHGIFVFASSCNGFDSFLAKKNKFDSLSNFAYDIIFNDDYVELKMRKERLENIGLTERTYIADENYYGKFVDQRVKIKLMMEEAKMQTEQIRISPFTGTPQEEGIKMNPKYNYLAGAFYFLFDESGKTITATYTLTPDDIVRLLIDTELQNNN